MNSCLLCDVTIPGKAYITMHFPFFPVMLNYISTYFSLITNITLTYTLQANVSSMLSQVYPSSIRQISLN